MSCGYDIAVKRRDPQALPCFSILLGRYLVGRVLGAGGFGITYVAQDLNTGERKAIKECFMRSSIMRGADGYHIMAASSKAAGQFAIGLEKFEKEVKILHSLRGKRAIVEVEGFFRENNTAYMIMEYIDGISLKEICKTTNGTVPLDTATGQLLDIAGVLREIHSLGLLHRDMGPDNIMVRADGSITVIDFGAARHSTGQETNTLTVLVKNGFAPIEQYSTKGRQGPWTDIYGIACTMYYYLSGVKPADAPSRQLNDTVVPLHRLRHDIPAGYSKVIEKAMSFKADDRYQSIDELVADIRRWSPGPIPPGPDGGGDGLGGPPSPNAMKRFIEKLRSMFSGPKPPPAPTGGDPPPQQRLFAQVEGGPFDGYMFPFPESGELVMGRDGGQCSAVLNAPSIGRLHCILKYDARDGSLTLTDRSSTGTFMANDQRLPFGEGVKIDFGERFYLSAPMFTVSVIRLTL